jgi:hypothetical protein
MVAIDRVSVDENVTLTGQALPADGRPGRVPASLYRFETVKNPSVRLEKAFVALNPVFHACCR